MAVPDYQSVMLPLLQFAAQKGTETSTSEAVEALATDKKTVIYAGAGTGGLALLLREVERRWNFSLGLSIRSSHPVFLFLLPKCYLSLFTWHNIQTYHFDFVELASTST